MTAKRIGAYIVDIFIILLLSNLLSTVLPNNQKLNKISEDVMNTFSEYTEVISQDSDPEVINTLLNKIENDNYEMSKLSVYSTITTIVLYFLYFILFQSYNNGQTLGKMLFKIRISSIDDKKLTFKQLLIRGIILYPILVNILNLIILFTMSKSIYLNASSVINMIYYVIFIVCFVTLFSGKGLHDRLAKTLVVDGKADSTSEEGKKDKWENSSKKDANIEKYKRNHTSGKKKGDKNE